MKTQYATSFWMKSDTKRLLASISIKLGISQNAALTIAIHRLAELENITPLDATNARGNSRTKEIMRDDK